MNLFDHGALHSTLGKATNWAKFIAIVMLLLAGVVGWMIVKYIVDTQTINEVMAPSLCCALFVFSAIHLWIFGQAGSRAIDQKSEEGLLKALNHLGTSLRGFGLLAIIMVLLYVFLILLPYLINPTWTATPISS